VTPVLRFEVGLFVALTVACEPEGPPRPTGEAPFPMPNPPSSGLPHTQSYDHDGDLVLDEVTGLSWQRSVDRGPGEMGGFIWEEAQDHCDELVQDGHDDFRLPTRLELVTLVDFTMLDPAIDAEAFPETTSEAYWTASPVATDPEQAFYVNFFFGYTSTNFRVYEQFVRCVRTAGQPELPTAADRFRIEGGTVLDRMTGLRWERTPTFVASLPESEMSRYARAANYCSTLVLDGESSFRMPSMKELQTLVDESRTDLAIDPETFPGATGDDYWTSSLLEGDPESAWFVRFSDGYSQYAALETPNLVRCVK
jgi:hypothetical protein